MQIDFRPFYRKRCGLIAGMASALLAFTTAVSAQDAVEEGLETTDPAEDEVEASTEADSAEDNSIEEIVVTGSRIGRNNLDSYANITVVNSEDIRLSGVGTADELLRQLPSLTLQGVSKQNNNGGGGLARVDLRNLGAGRTLVLLNGRRIIGAFGGGVDLNNVPIHMVERIEVLLDGASAVYGSDAVAGVVNIVLKEDYEGFRVDLHGGITTYGDGENLTISSTLGGNFDDGNAVVNLTYYRRNEIWQKDRDWAEPPVVAEYYDDVDGDGEIDYDQPQTLYNSSYTPGGTLYSYGGSFGPQHFKPDGDYAPFDNGMEDDNPYGDRYSYGLDQWLIGRLNRVSVTALGTYELSEFVKAYAEGEFTFRHSLNQLAPQPIGGGTAIIPGRLPIPITNPFVPDELAEMATADDNGTFWMSRRMAEIGRRQYENSMKTFRVITGIEGEIGHRFSWDVYVNYSKMFNSAVIHNAVNLRNLRIALDPDLCAANALCPGVANLFGAGNMQDDVAEFVRFRSMSQSMWDMAQTGMSVQGKLAELPGGFLTGVVGGDFRWERGYTLPDSRITGGDSAGNIFEFTGGDYNVQEAFVEFSIPILKGLPGADELTVDLAGRFSNYNTFGSEFTYRAGLAYGPLPDIRFRGIYSTAFRAPSIANLYGGSRDSYQIVADPCVGWESSDDSNLRENCQDDGVPENWTQAGTQIRTNVGSNPDLTAETSAQLNIGTVITPTFIPKSAGTLSATFDFYKISVDNAITNLDSQTITNKCYYSEDKSHEYCQYISARGASHDISGINATLRNIAEIETKGLDFTFNYLLPITPQFRANFNFHGNVLLQLEEKNIAADTTEDRLGTIASMSNYNGALAKFRFRTDLTLGTGLWKLSNRVRYIGPVEVFGWDGTTPDDPSDDLPTHDLKAMAYWDLSGLIMWKGLDFIVGMDNVLDATPPYIPAGDANSNANTYDFMGRYVYAKIGYQF